MSRSMKVVLVGDCNVGKTSIANRLVKNEFNEETSATVAAVFHQTIIDDELDSYELDIWDTAGQEKYRSMITSYFRGANGGVVVFDVMDKQSYKHVKEWEDEIKKTAPQATILIIGNKAESSEWFIDRETLEKQLQDDGYDFSFVSAKTGYNLKNTFAKLAAKMKPHERTENTVVLKQKQEEDGCC